MKHSLIDFLSELANLKTVVPSFLTAIGGAWGGWFFARKKLNAETKSIEQESYKIQLKTTFESIESFQERLKMAFLELKENQDELSGLRRKNNDLEMKLMSLQIDIERMRVWSCSDGECTDRVEYKNNISNGNGYSKKRNRK